MPCCGLLGVVVNKDALQSSMWNSEQVLITAGNYAGQHGYVTWVDDKYARVTPVHDDPLLSIECKHADLEIKESL